MCIAYLVCATSRATTTLNNPYLQVILEMIVAVVFLFFIVPLLFVSHTFHLCYICTPHHLHLAPYKPRPDLFRPAAPYQQ